MTVRVRLRGPVQSGALWSYVIGAGLTLCAPPAAFSAEMFTS